MAHVVEQAAILSAVLVDKSHRWGSGAHAGHGDTSFWRSHPAYTVPNMTDEGLGVRGQCVALLCITVLAGLGANVGVMVISGAPSALAMPNAIQAENSLPGDSTWGDFNANLSQTALSGYSSPISVNHGQTVDFYVTTTSANVTIDIYRMGW